MVVRGAPAIGVAAAGGIALGVQHLRSGSTRSVAQNVLDPGADPSNGRELFWAIERMRACVQQYSVRITQLQQVAD